MRYCVVIGQTLQCYFHLYKHKGNSFRRCRRFDASSCINAIRRSIARRGQCSKILSDNGSNLLGVKRDIRWSIAEWDKSQIHTYLLQKNIDRHF